MIEVKLGKKNSFTKDGNKLGANKMYRLIHDVMPLIVYGNEVKLFIYDYKPSNKEKKVWSVHGIGDIFPELNSYLLTFKEAISLVNDSVNADEFNEFVIYIIKD